VSPSPTLRGREAQRFGGGIDIEPCLAAIDAGLHHRQADAVAGDGCTVGNRCLIVAARDPQPVQLALRGRLDAGDFAKVGDDAGEHLGSS
jgi:hypothetical protein